MKLSEEEKKALMTNRMNRALETWEETKGIISNNFWYAAANRMYYACYYMTTALLIKHGYSASTHSGVIRLFGQYFISTGIVSREMGRLYSKVYELRQSGDYDDWISIGQEDILPLAASVDEYLKELKKLIDV
ncbi:HEPN domain-containing protein [Bacteroides timonensis]|uniref:HEPN domain-containing protein n=1 Tax=Bacteroides timonensis TaxID=1470345 RepID=UPI0004B13C85|nr:HEPN domain-containing protein [Bacteroides timonensis]